MRSTTRFLSFAALVTMVMPVCGLAEEPIRVLPKEIGGKPAAACVQNQLLDVASAYLRERQKQIEKLTTIEALRKRQEYVKTTILDSFGGLPERTPLNAEVVGVIERDDFVVEKVIFESRPGFHVTGVLYQPKKGSRPLAAVLVPCGHSAVGKAEPAYQQACILMARNGLAVFCYDPISQGERYQTLNDAGKPAIPSSTEEHTNIGIGALLVGGNTAEIRIWDGMRAIDYLQSRDDIDPERIGVTGNSGGGTMTAYLMCLDDRVKAAAPSCYITSFEKLLRTIGTQDAEQNFTGFVAKGLDMADFVERMAPKPVLICTATKDFFDVSGSWDTFREAKRVYGRFGFPERVDLIEGEDAHGFSKPRRVAAARWMRRWLMGAQEPIDEPENAVFKTEELQCTETGQVLASLKGRSAYDLNREKEAKLAPERRAAFEKSDRKAWVRRVAEIIGSSEKPAPDKVTEHGTIERKGYRISKISFEVGGLPVPGLLCVPEKAPGRAEGVVYVNGDGMATDAGETGPISALARSGRVVLAIDPPGIGETAEVNAKKSSHNKRFGADWPTVFLAFHVGKTMVGLRSDAIRAAVDLLARRPEVNLERIGLIAVGDATVPALHAGALDERIRTVITEGGLDSFERLVQEWNSEGMFSAVVPGALRHYDLPMLEEAIKPRTVRRVASVDGAGKAISEPAGSGTDRFVKILEEIGGK